MRNKLAGPTAVATGLAVASAVGLVGAAPALAQGATITDLFAYK